MRLKSVMVLLGLSLVMAACAQPPATADPRVVPELPAAAPQAAPVLASEPTAVAIEPADSAAPTATASPAPAPAASAEPTAIPEAAPAEDAYSVTEDGLYVRGLASAAVVVEDYSDFL